ncbi:transposase [Solibacillus silvestris]
MILARKVRLKPTNEQEVLLWRSVGTARWVYNWTLVRQHENYQQGNKFLTDNCLRKEITQLKKTDEYSWLSEVSNNVAKQAVKDACNAYKRFFKGLAKYPKFKSKKTSKPSFYNDNLKLKVKRFSVLIEKVGWLHTSEQLPMGVRYTNPRITFDGKYWYLSLGIEREESKLDLTDEVIGIDLGIKELAVCSNQMVFKNINKSHKLKKIEKRLRRLQRSVSRKYSKNKEGKRYVKTSNIIKIEKQIRNLYRRLSNIRLNHVHQSTNAIVKTKPCKVVMENLNISGMIKNRHLSEAIAKQKFYEFIRQMKYKCDKNGIEFIQVGRFYPSSKTCSQCSTIKTDLKLSDRIYKCDCGLQIDRDLNAAINLANFGKSVV